MKKILLITIGIFVVGGAVGYGFGVSRNPKGVAPEKSATDIVPASSPGSSTVPSTTSSPPPKASRQQKVPTVTQQSSAWRMQFSGCKAAPDAFTLKEGASLRFENLDPTSRRISFDIQIFNILPYGSAAAVAKPVGIHSVICDGAGVGTLTVQP